MYVLSTCQGRNVRSRVSRIHGSTTALSIRMWHYSCLFRLFMFVSLDPTYRMLHLLIEIDEFQSVSSAAGNFCKAESSKCSSRIPAIPRYRNYPAISLTRERRCFMHWDMIQRRIIWWGLERPLITGFDFRSRQSITMLRKDFNMALI